MSDSVRGQSGLFERPQANHSEQEPLRIVADNDLYIVADFKMTDSTMSITILKPGKSTRGHRHTDKDETYHFLHGEADLVLGTDSHRVAKHSSHLIPKNKWHQVRNVSKADVVVFVCKFKGARDEYTYDYEVNETPAPGNVGIAGIKRNPPAGALARKGPFTGQTGI